jgi:signal transduction histidine kinase
MHEPHEQRRQLHARRRELMRLRWERSPRRLQRQIFWSFGFAILITMVSVGFVNMFLWSAGAHWPVFRLFAFFCAGNVLWMFSGALARRLAQPLQELTGVVKEFGSGKLDRRAQPPRHSSREVVELVGTFNDMAGRVETLVQEQRELLGTVSHELRTPLARLRVLLAIMQDQSAGDPALIAKFEREILEMDALVGELLAEARISAGALTLRALDLGDVVRECAERLGVTLAEPMPSVRVQADATLLSRAMTLLLDNAHKHGGHSIRVRSEAEGAFLRVFVEDDGPGFEADDLPKLFAAFTRGSGKEADEKRGVGLGLYLVRRIAEAHGGSAFAENLPSGGARVGCVLPRAMAA